MPKPKKLTITITETDWNGAIINGSTDPLMQLRLWKGEDSNGNPVLAWMPEWISEHLVLPSEFDHHRPLQHRRLRAEVQRRPKGAN